jgi:hypothetical protein
MAKTSWKCGQLFKQQSLLSSSSMMAYSSQILFYLMLFVQVSLQKWLGDKEIGRDRERVSITSSLAQHRTTGLGCCHEIKNHEN